MTSPEWYRVPSGSRTEPAQSRSASRYAAPSTTRHCGETPGNSTLISRTGIEPAPRCSKGSSDAYLSPSLAIPATPDAGLRPWSWCGLRRDGNRTRTPHGHRRTVRPYHSSARRIASRTDRSSMRLVTTTSAPVAASAGEPAAVAPASSSGCIFAAVRLPRRLQARPGNPPPARPSVGRTQGTSRSTILVLTRLERSHSSPPRANAGHFARDLRRCGRLRG